MKESILPEDMEKLQTTASVTLEKSHGKEELVQPKASTENENPVEDFLTDMCPTHKELLIVDCFDCGNPICPQCIVKEHNGHQLRFSKIFAPDTQEKLMENLKPLTEVKASLSHSVKKVQATKRELEAQGLSVAKSIEASFLNLQKIVDDHKKQLLEETSKSVKLKMDKLSLQEESLSLTSAEVQSVLDHIGRHDKNEFVGMDSELSSPIQQGTDKNNERVVSLEPAEKVDVGVEVKCAETLHQLCRSKAKMTQLSAIISKRMENALLYTVSEATLTTTKCFCEVDCRLKSLSDGSIMKCNVDQTGVRDYSIQYTPTVRGQHELMVSVDGQEVTGSPFPVFVSISPTEFDEPVNEWYRISQPTAITANSMGEIIVASDGDILIIDEKEAKMDSFPHELGLLLMLTIIFTALISSQIRY